MNKILIVDDEIEILSVVKLILVNSHFDVETTSHWQDIYSSIDKYKPDLILLDVSLGGADGREICIKLKNDEATGNIPIILFSANYNLINNLKGCNANAVISKPFDAENLIAIINQNLN